MNDRLTRVISQYPITTALIAGLCMGSGFIWSPLWPAAIFGIALVLMGVEVMQTWHRLGVYVLVSWFIKSLIAFGFIWYAYPVDWVPQTTPAMQVGGIVLYWITTSLWLALGGLVFAAASWFLVHSLRLHRYLIWFLFPLVWLVAERAGAVIFSLMMVGPGSFVQSYFSFGMIGYLFATTPLGLWSAAFGGVDGLTISMVVLAVGVVYGAHRLSLVRYGFVMAVCYGVILVCSPVSDYRAETPVTVVAVDTQFSAQLHQSMAGMELKAAMIAQAVDEAVALASGYVVLPEDSRYLATQFDSAYPNQAMSIFQFTHGNTDTVLIDSGRHITSDGPVLRAHIFDGVSKKMWQVDKQYLVPQGEYMPTFYNVLFRVLGYGAVVNSIQADRSYIPGPLVQTDALPEHIPGVLFCFESIQPGAVHDLAHTRGLPFVAHPISHAWFHTPTILWKQIDVMLQVQARRSGVPIVSAGNMAVGKLYLPDGRIQSGTVLTTNDWYTLREYRF